MAIVFAVADVSDMEPEDALELIWVRFALLGSRKSLDLFPGGNKDLSRIVDSNQFSIALSLINITGADETMIMSIMKCASANEAPLDFHTLSAGVKAKIDEQSRSVAKVSNEPHSIKKEAGNVDILVKQASRWSLFAPGNLFPARSREGVYERVEVRAVDGGVDDDEEQEGDEEATKNIYFVLVVFVTIMILFIIDGRTTNFFGRCMRALGDWTIKHAPGSFIVFETVIAAFIMCCLPYSPLAALSGAMFVHKYGDIGVVYAWLLLVVFTFFAYSMCFFLARYKLKESVQRKIMKEPSLKFFKNLDLLIQRGQGIEMAMLLRLAPFPKGPTHYFLGTTSITLRDYYIGTLIPHLPMCFIDVGIGAGAKHAEKHKSPAMYAIFVLLLLVFFTFIGWVGLRAKKKLDAIEEQEQENEEEAAGGGGQKKGGEGAIRVEEGRSGDKV